MKFQPSFLSVGLMVKRDQNMFSNKKMTPNPVKTALNEQILFVGFFYYM